jgi:hypothetical protein
MATNLRSLKMSQIDPPTHFIDSRQLHELSRIANDHYKKGDKDTFHAISEIIGAIQSDQMLVKANDGEAGYKPYYTLRRGNICD